MVLNIIISILVWSAVGIGVVKLLNNSGLVLPDNGIKKILFNEVCYDNQAASFKECRKVALLALAYRIFIYLLAVPIMIIFIKKSAVSFDDYLSIWQKWDATNYIRIAESGYSYVEDGKHLTLVFFPLYSIIMRIFNIIFGDMRLTGLIVSTLCYSTACGYIYALTSLEYNKSIAKWTVIFLSVFSFSFFFGGIMSESTFLLMTTMTFYYIKTHQWGKVAIFGALSAMSRLIGAAAALPAAIEWCEEYKPFKLIKEKEWRKIGELILKKGIFIVAILSGTLVYLAMNYITTGNAFQFMEYQKTNWYHENCYFANTVVSILKNAVDVNIDIMLRMSIWLPSAVILVLATALLVYSAFRHKAKYVLYFAAYLIINTSVTWLISLPRYMSALFPMFIILSEFTEKHKWLRYIIFTVFFELMILYLVWYFMGRQIL